METRAEYTVTNSEQSTKLLRLPTDLHEWFKAEAIRQDRSANAEMVRALKAYRAAREISVSDVKAELFKE